MSESQICSKGKLLRLALIALIAAFAALIGWWSIAESFMFGLAVIGWLIYGQYHKVLEAKKPVLARILSWGLPIAFGVAVFISVMSTL
jgi:positive regulator of sigma E activity